MIPGIVALGLEKQHPKLLLLHHHVTICPISIEIASFSPESSPLSGSPISYCDYEDCYWTSPEAVLIQVYITVLQYPLYSVILPFSYIYSYKFVIAL